MGLENKFREREIEKQREKVIILKSRSIYIKNHCSLVNSRKNLNNNLSFLVIILY